MKTRAAFLTTLFLLLVRLPARAGSGTEGASFLDIPVGAEPAALGAAYSAVANNAYAPMWNPGGLGNLSGPQMMLQHLNYLETMHYESLGFAAPVRAKSGIGLSVQYLGSGSIDA